ncbi:site-specific DNA-methyltransferase [Aerococcus sanguinicola]|uniref:DNA methylase N-4 n=1 Tax=Aerococcus sanguinicola TaxID=119206 RepID=A0A0X8FB88_9LACT|nr:MULTISPECIES: site-specific DNA-methyltransferase [Aerococcus]AMB94172.1 DNA methylase N-4 [Aerococcus sanguinicola]MDK7050053.1 site-specific DNA-methyltransferase [Aerococcus sanguinicola]OFT92329.1 DNA methylase N-4 [Aerococcus sp. HMSC23C02]PKZ22345.1 site-specific DNA-methyltransferase [Aerococcus sanguinicola]
MTNQVPSGSLDLTQNNIEKLKELFPEVITDGGKIDFETLQTILGEEIDDEGERYSFTWPGKRESILGSQLPSKGTLRPNVDKSKDFDHTGNLYIEGDNLEVLKLLQKSYNSKVKVIYIDPPYNTGKDFVYKDDFREGVENYLEQTGQVDSDGNLLSTNSESNGRFHTDWLNMMYPRLRLARNLLAEDGVIFISIDDGEVANLKKVCSEIFGEKNFLAQVIWERAYAPVNLKKNFSESHDFILVYGKNTDGLESNGIARSDRQIDSYINPDNDPRGIYKPDNFTVGPAVEKNIYEITTPSGRVVLPPNGYSWRFSKERFNELLSDNRVWFGKDGNNVPAYKRFLSEVKSGVTPMTIWKYDDVGHSQSATKYLRNLMDGKAYFDYPKPVDLIKRCIELYSEPDSIVLDFFAGSATTAEAVMKKNAEDSGSRKYIMVQLPEVLEESSTAYKDGYRNLTDIAVERIRRAGDKIIDENPELADTLDIGFKYFQLDKSNIQEWNPDFEDLENDKVNLFEDVFVEGRSELDIVYEIMLKNGLELILPITTFEIEGKIVYDIAYGSQFICLAHGIDLAVAEGIITKRDDYDSQLISGVVFKDKGFKGNDAMKLNVIQALVDADFAEEAIQTI